MATQPTEPITIIAEEDVNLPSTGQPNKELPNTAVLTTGYDDNQVVTAENLNYVFNNLAKWLEYSILFTEELKQYTETEFDSLQFKEYNSSRVYNYLDIVWVDNGGTREYYQWYSNVESLSGKDPLLTSNRRTGWSDDTKPFYWLPYSSKLSGETISWDDDNIPENMVLGQGQQLSALTYHTLASAKPDWIDIGDSTKINIPDRQGRFSRAADGSTWIAGSTHEDGIRNITMEVRNAMRAGTGGTSTVTGAGTLGPLGTSVPDDFAQSSYNGFNFDASLQVPTTDENQPKGYIEWKGYAL